MRRQKLTKLIEHAHPQMLRDIHRGLDSYSDTEKIEIEISTALTAAIYLMKLCAVEKQHGREQRKAMTGSAEITAGVIDFMLAKRTAAAQRRLSKIERT